MSTAASDSVRWFAVLAELAARVVEAAAVVPAITTREQETAFGLVAEVHWMPIVDSTIGDALSGLAESMPPICVPDQPHLDDSARRDVVAAIFARFVDTTTRARLHEASWQPVVPADRAAGTAVARAVFRGLTGQDARVQLSRIAHVDSLGAVEEHLRRAGQRARGEPVLIRRLRLVVPDDRHDPWRVELELVDEADRGRWCSAADVWAGNPLAVEVATDARHLPVLEAMVDELAATVAATVDVLAALATAVPPRSHRARRRGGRGVPRAGTGCTGTAGHRARRSRAPRACGVAVRGRATPSPASDRAAGLGRETLVQWTFTAVDGGGPTAISAAELARAEHTGASLLHVGNRWVRIDPAALRKVRARHDAYLRRIEELAGAERDGTVSPLALLQLAADAAAAGDDLGIGAVDTIDAVAGDTVSEAWAGLLLGGLPDAELQEANEPPSFAGALRPYQRRGLGWLRFLDRLGLGGCLADDMGLGKTPTTLAHLVDRPGPHLVVCPLSVVHNWETEARRFTPTMAVTVHHGAGRHGRQRRWRRTGAGTRHL